MPKKNVENNQKLLQLVKKAHGMIENDNLEKARHSQEYIGALVGRSKELNYKVFTVDGICGEWISVNYVHIKKKLILHCHGGGYSTGGSMYARTITSKLAVNTGIDVVCFDYRLAPEFPYPAALTDALAVWDHLMYLGYGAKDIIVTGDSAGGNLALALMLKLKEQNRILPAGLVLMSPWTDLTSSGESFTEKEPVDPVLTNEYIYKMVDAYAGNYNLKEPLISPLFGSFKDFPPTYIQVGENEILLSDSQRLYKKMKKQGVPVALDIFPGMWHVFQMAPFKGAAEALDRVTDFILNKTFIS